MAKVPVNPSVDDLARGIRDLRREVDRISGGGLTIRGNLDMRGYRVINTADSTAATGSGERGAQGATGASGSSGSSGVTGPLISTIDAITTWGDTSGLTLLSGTAKLTSAGALSGLTTVGVSDQITSTLATGTAPLVVASTTLVANLNADLLDGNEASVFQTKEMARVAGSTYSTVQHLQDIFHSTGLSSGGTINDAGSGNITVDAGTGFIRATNDPVDVLLYFDWPALGSTAIPSDTVRYIGVEYNGGSPQVVVHTTYDWNFNTDFPLGSVVNDGGTLHLENAPHQVGDHASLMIQRAWATMPRVRDERDGGLILGESADANRYVTLTQGALWERLEKFTIPAIDTSGADTFDAYYRDGAGGWTEVTGQSAWPFTQYDDNSGTLQDLTANKFAVLWFYIELDGNLVMLYGQSQNTSEAAAEAESPPTTVPERVSVQSKLIGRIIFKKSTTPAVVVESVFTTTFSGSVVSDHAFLSNLDWTNSAHTGTANGVAGFSGAGAASEFTTTGTGTVLALQTSPQLVTPEIDVATGTSLDLSETLTTPDDASLSVATTYESTSSGFPSKAADFFIDNGTGGTSNDYMVALWAEADQTAAAGGNAYSVGVHGRGNTSAGTSNGTTGVYGDALVDSGATTSSAIGGSFSSIVSSGGTATNVIGAILSANVDAGATVTKATSLYVADPGSNATTSWAIEALGGDSYHVGNFRIGDTTAPTEALEVVGEIQGTSVAIDGNNDGVTGPLAGYLLTGGLSVVDDGTDVVNDSYAGVLVDVQNSPVSGSQGVSGQIVNVGGGGTNLSYVASYEGNTQVLAGGTATDAYGLYLAMSVGAGATLGGYEGIRVRDPSGTGTITDNVGLAIDAMVQGTNNWAIQSNGGDSYHVGDFRIGSTSAPTVALDVTGSVLASGSGSFVDQVTIEDDGFFSPRLALSDASGDYIQIGGTDGALGADANVLFRSALGGAIDYFVTEAATQTLTNKTLTSPTLTTPNIGVATGTSLNLADLTAGRVVFAGTAGLLDDDAGLLWDNTNRVFSLVDSSTQPIIKLDTSAGTATRGMLQFYSDRTTGVGASVGDIQWHNNSATAGAIIQALAGSSDTQAHLRFLTSGVNERMRIDEDGNVGIGTASPATSALLDLTSTTGALLLPRMTTTQRNALTAANGMVIYNTTTATIQGYQGSAWTNL